MEELMGKERTKNKLIKALEEFERNLILSTMENHGWSRKKTAQELGIPISTLKFKMKKLGIYEIVQRLGK